VALEQCCALDVLPDLGAQVAEARGPPEHFVQEIQRALLPGVQEFKHLSKAPLLQLADDGLAPRVDRRRTSTLR
jgi:hypothetical protein